MFPEILIRSPDFTTKYIPRNNSQCSRYSFKFFLDNSRHVFVCFFLLGWTWKCLEDWGEFSKVAVSSIFMTFIFWFCTEVGTFLAGNYRLLFVISVIVFKFHIMSECQQNLSPDFWINLCFISLKRFPNSSVSSLICN